eukprot:CCRYP_009402-RA/>CCRYP_009402-RA protein AED:0.51 eAED:0.44 QI:0/0/0/1/0/0/2/0/120
MAIPPLSKQNITHIQQIVGSFLYYAATKRSNHSSCPHHTTVPHSGTDTQTMPSLPGLHGHTSRCTFYHTASSNMVLSVQLRSEATPPSKMQKAEQQQNILPRIPPQNNQPNSPSCARFSN